jgi:hypothetical protein
MLEGISRNIDPDSRRLYLGAVRNEICPREPHRPGA